MKRFLNWKLFLVLIIFLAAFLRFYQLGLNPPSLTWDEAAWGYNAYSLGIDGKDEFGKFLPLDYLESFGDFKPPMYAYLDIIPVKIFGLNEFSTRFPSALFGVLTVLMTFFLVKRIFWNKEIQNTKYKIQNINNLAILSALFLAISPWHIMLSRAAFEANVATFFIVFGVWAFLAGVQDKKWYLILSAAFFALSFYTFNTARIVSPLLVLLLAFSFRKQLLTSKRQVVLAIVLGFLMLLPISKFLISPQASLRFKEVNIFSDIKVIQTTNQEIKNDNNSLFSKIIHNRRFAYGASFVEHYLDNLSPSFLFIKGDGNPKFSTQTVGQLYLWDLPFFIIGILFLLRKKEGNWWLIPAWLLLAIIPAATARETPHALRIETTLPMFQILVAYGFVQLIDRIGKYRKFIVYCLLFVLFINFSYFYHDYSTHYARIYSGEWQYGYKQSIDYVKSVQNNYDYVQITSAMGRPYVYYLLYTKTDPKYFRENSVVKRDVFGFVTVEKFGKYTFPKKYDYDLNKNKKVLYINTPYSLPKNIKILKTFYLLNGQPILVAYTL